MMQNLYFCFYTPKCALQICIGLLMPVRWITLKRRGKSRKRGILNGLRVVWKGGSGNLLEIARASGVADIGGGVRPGESRGWPISLQAEFHACLFSGRESGVWGLEWACQTPSPLGCQSVCSLCQPPGETELCHSWTRSVCRAVGRKEPRTNTRF